uniref:Uncharacterized protein n=1 Tax=Leersia perrieri TaxID=77586 RepID=A0A0D9XD04_9ORYZ
MNESILLSLKSQHHQTQATNNHVPENEDEAQEHQLVPSHLQHILLSLKMWATNLATSTTPNVTTAIVAASIESNCCDVTFHSLEDVILDDATVILRGDWCFHPLLSCVEVATTVVAIASVAAS